MPKNSDKLDGQHGLRNDDLAILVCFFVLLFSCYLTRGWWKWCELGVVKNFKKDLDEASHKRQTKKIRQKRVWKKTSQLGLQNNCTS